MARAAREGFKVIPEGQRKCVWMEAGVVSYKTCTHNFDCPTCEYDQALRNKVARAQAAQEAKFDRTWAQEMLRLPASQRVCRYMISGHVDYKLCPSAYECGSCDYDQQMQERMEPARLPVGVIREIMEFKVAEGFYFHEGHAWARSEHGGRVRVGVSDFIQHLLGGLASIDLPDIGHPVVQGEPVAMLRKNGHAVKLRAPVSGVVSRINQRIKKNPSLINREPYEEGWLFIVEPSKLKKNLKKLKTGEDAQGFIAQERERLIEVMSDDLRVAADGGPIDTDVFKELSGERWESVVGEFTG